ncbi:hypothetical protein AC579_1766 [Pseudocercospora musae]|uniref:Uncharacterized protein n=1 Tax=Pseudocercospora musae TaxID=113226 RepID=A0A139IP30_9PEZI|nr:hypothetical protein AC579_1766 [Pseudocercospora musae]
MAAAKGTCTVDAVEILASSPSPGFGEYSERDVSEDRSAAQQPQAPLRATLEAEIPSIAPTVRVETVAADCEDEMTFRKEDWQRLGTHLLAHQSDRRELELCEAVLRRWLSAKGVGVDPIAKLCW